MVEKALVEKVSVEVATFYQFAPMQDLDALREQWLSQGAQMQLRGTILLAEEGINGTLCGTRENLDRFLEGVRQLPQLAQMAAKYSTARAENPVFHRFKIKIKAEIVTFGVPGLRPAQRTGVHVDPAAWNKLLDDPEVVVVDTRNRYETVIGSFPGAQDPDTTNFREFPDYVRSHLDPDKNKKVAMFCTGGIRCEKASAFLLEEGFESVYQLDGGILRYLEEVDEASNRWHGECFVFDQRVSVDASLGEGAYEQCFACRHPLSQEDLASEHFEEGVSCPHCIDEMSQAQRESFAERHKQVLLAESRGEAHIGVKQTSKHASS